MNASKLKKYDKEIIERYSNGESTRDIGKSFRSYDSSISYRLKVNGIQKRTISEAMKGKIKTEEHKRKVSLSRIISGCAKGNKNPNWKGGIQDNWSELKNSSEYKEWRSKVYKRDNWTCKGCGDKTGGNLHAHHILPRKHFPELTLKVNNGITLCKKCHEKTMGREEKFIAFFQKVVNSGNILTGELKTIPSQALY